MRGPLRQDSIQAGSYGESGAHHIHRSKVNYPQYIRQNGHNTCNLAQFSEKIVLYKSCLFFIINAQFLDTSCMDTNFKSR